MTRRRSGNWSTRCRSPWSRWSTISRSTSAAPSPTADRRRTRAAAGLLRLDGAALAAADPRRSRPLAAPSWTLRRRLPHAARSWPAWSRRCSIACCRDAGAARRRSGIASANCSSRTGSIAVQHEQIRADLRSGRIGLAQNRLPAEHRDRRCRAGDVVDATRAVPDELSAAGHARRWQTARWRWFRWRPAPAAAGRRAPAWSRRCTRSASWAAAPHVHRDPPGQEPADRPCGGMPLPHIVTTSYLTHEPIADFLSRAAELQLSRAAAALARPGGRPAARSRWCATCVRSGRKCRSSCSTSRSRRCARACTPP